jgi:hypothetical protein
MSSWKQLPEDLPVDEEEVWIRIKYYYGSPFLATWNEATQDFTSTDNSIVYPAWTVARWKSQT